MKNLLVLLSAVTSFSFAQDIPQSQVPAVVVNGFQQKYSKAADVEWEKKGEIFEVEFETGIPSKDHKMHIDKAGKVIMHAQDIAKSELPALVRKSIRQQFPGYASSDAVRIEQKGVVTYQVELEKKKDDRKVTFDIKGKVVENIAD